MESMDVVKTRQITKAFLLRQAMTFLGQHKGTSSRKSRRQMARILAKRLTKKAGEVDNASV